jgi:hypothetical protein
MDFKSILNKLDSMEERAVTPAAPTIPATVQLNEDAQMRVLAGQTSFVAEAKKQKEEEMKEEMKVGDKKSSSTGGTIEKTKTGVKHTAGKNYGGSEEKDDDDADHPADKKAKKAKKESIEPEFKSKFMKMVEAKKDEADKKKTDKKKPMKEAAKPDFLDIDKDGDKKEPMKKAAGEKSGDKKAGKKGMSAKQEKFFGKKKTVKESVETKLSFKDMVKLVQESGGQQAIDPVDSELFAWAQRVASSKFTESTKAELYAGLVYERMGGVFEMYDVLSEDTK